MAIVARRSLALAQLILLLHAGVRAAEDEPLRPVLTYQSGGEEPIIDRVATGAGRGFEGGRVVKVDDSYYLLTAEFKDWPVNANMRVSVWRSDVAGGASGWRRVTTIAESKGDPEHWSETCSAQDLHASPWAPFALYAEEEERWHVHWVSYACDLSWVVRVGIGNIMGAASSVRGRAGIAGPYEPYGVVIGPNATAPNATRWGDLSACAPCHAAASPPPPYCSTRPCRFDNSITGAAIAASPFALPPGAGARYASFVGLDHGLAWSDSPRGPWTVGTEAQLGQDLASKLSTPSSPYTENPVVTRVTRPDGGYGFLAVFDTVSPAGGWVLEEGEWRQGGRGEFYGFGASYSSNGQYWTQSWDVALPGGCRTPLGMIQEPDGSLTLLFTRRFPDCAQPRLAPGSRGDSANDRSMCAEMYAAKFSLSWESGHNPVATPRLVV